MSFNSMSARLGTVAVLCAAIWSVSMVAVAEPGPTKLSRRCRGASANGVTLLTQTGLRVIDRCVKRATSSEELQQCGTIDAAEGTPYGRANSRAGLKLGAYCPSTNPTVVTNFEGADVSTLVLPEIQALLQDTTQSALSPSDRSRKCTDTIIKSGSAVVRAALGRAVECQKRVDARSKTFGPLDPSCLRGAGGAGKRAESAIGRRCGSAATPSAQDCTPFPSCTVTAATEVGEQLAADVYSFSSGMATGLCGNGVLDAGETCDDGNTDSTDACTAACQEATCGDQVVQAGVEQCDDGNVVEDDCCTTACTAPVCGDGVVAAGCGEDCDAVGDPTCVNCKFVPVVCDGSGLVATVAVRSDLAGVEPAGLRLELGAPETLNLPLIAPGIDFVDPESGAITNLTGIDSLTLSAQWVDSNGNGVRDNVDLLAFGTQIIPSGGLVSIRFDCPAGTSVRVQDFTCGITQASDKVGNDLPRPSTIPCSVTSISLGSAATSSSQP